MSDKNITWLPMKSYISYHARKIQQMSYHPQKILSKNDNVRGCVDIPISGNNIPTPKRGAVFYFIYFISPH